MCGIAGVLSPQPLTEQERTLLVRMNGALIHRGPDSEGILIDGNIGLAMRRLSIVDLKGGQQPVYNETRQVAAVCNGEIYNYRELRGTLQQQGHRLTSEGDIEALVHLYEQHDLGFLDHLRGMFALALWDRTRRRLILARDRMGEKPLYLYRDDAGRRWFASEMKSLLTVVPPERRRLSPASVNLFLTYQYVPEPATMCEGIWKLPAGHLLEWSPDKPNRESRPYWNYLELGDSPPTGDPVRLVRAELERACELMGTADVPVGVALSGGIDSSVVAALTARHYPQALHAFSVGYPGRPQNDERRMASEFAARLGIPFHEVELKAEDLVDGFPHLVKAMDDPIGDIAAYGYYAVAKLARDHDVPVLLSGLGGDEFFWGYEWVRDCVRRAKRARWWHTLSAWRDRLMRAGGSQIRMRPSFYDIHDELVNGDHWSRDLMPHAVSEALTPDLWKRHFEISAWDRLPVRLSHVLNQTWLLSNCLALADRLSMAHSIEMRLPLLDVGVVELVTRLRQSGLADWGKPHKWLLIEAVKDLIPPEVLSRPKQGFSPPVQTWYHMIVTSYERLLDGGMLVQLGVLDGEALRRNRSGYSPPFMYKLLLLEIWCRSCLIGEHEENIRLSAYAH